MDNEKTTSVMRPLRVLVVDDSATNLDILEAMLTKMGCDVQCAASGQEAIDASRQTPFSLIFMDCQMPRMDGFAATREIRKQEGLTRHTPITALTANSLDVVREPCLAAGMDDVLIKPASVEDLSAMLAKWARPVDASLLANLREELGGEGSSIYGEAIATYIQESLSHLHAMEKASTDQQGEAIAREAHVLKGSSGYFGALRIQTLCVTIEALVKTASLTEIPRYVTDLKIEFQRVRETLELEAHHGAA